MTFYLEHTEHVYAEVPEGLITLPAAARKYGVTRNALHKRLQTGSLQSRGRLRGGFRGRGAILLWESELARVAESIAANRHHRKGIPVNIPANLDTGCEYSPSCLDCPLPVCKEDLTPSEQMKLRREVLPFSWRPKQ